MDNINPLYIYHTNHLGLVFVSKPFDGSNYLTWHRSVMRAIDGHNKLSLVDGYLPEPDSEDASKLHLWKPNDSIVASWILDSNKGDKCEGDLLHIYVGDLDRFEELLQSEESTKIFLLKKALLTCTQGTESINTYFTQF